ncbi:MAG: hypothetical protein HQM15_07755 [Deltaproteobacteria bacterium]|nr:hypothetical protein [Deltaproteobacteria bacterium]
MGNSILSNPFTPGSKITNYESLLHPAPQTPPPTDRNPDTFTQGSIIGVQYPQPQRSTPNRLWDPRQK